MPLFAKYSPVSTFSTSSQFKESLIYSGAGWDRLKKARTHHAASTKVYILLGLLIVSIVTNLLQTVALKRGFETNNSNPNPNIANLAWDVPRVGKDDPRDIDDPIWDAPEYRGNVGYITLRHDFAKANGIRASQNWPWDTSKGMYILQGFHSMHCLSLLRDAIRHYRNSQQPSWPLGHITHCLHVLREDILCLADDFTHYTGGVNQTKANHTGFLPPGTGQVRTCRSWDKLYQFAIQNSACYYRPPDKYTSVLERFKHCPDGSKPWENRREPLIAVDQEVI